jgi:hypothetical protein
MNASGEVRGGEAIPSLAQCREAALLRKSERKLRRFAPRCPDLWSGSFTKVYFSRDYDVSLDVGNWTSSTNASHEPGMTYYFASTAYNTEGSESGYSNEVSVKIRNWSWLRSMPWLSLLLDD